MERRLKLSRQQISEHQIYFYFTSPSESEWGLSERALEETRPHKHDDDVKCCYHRRIEEEKQKIQTTKITASAVRI